MTKFEERVSISASTSFKPNHAEALNAKTQKHEGTAKKPRRKVKTAGFRTALTPTNGAASKDF